MGFQCAPQVMGLARKVGKGGKSKNVAIGYKILQEMLEERYSKSATRDKTRSKDNVYHGFTSGTEMWEDMCERAENFRVKVRSNKDGSKKGRTTHERKLRQDAVIGWSYILKPPAEVVADWDDATKAKFLEDGMWAMAEIHPGLFRKENIRAIAEHNDEEGWHAHLGGDAIDEDGNYSVGHEVGSQAFMERMNRDFPKLMRSRGWDVADIDYTDRKKYATDPVYRAERKAKAAARKSGKTVNEYVDNKLKKLQAGMEEARLMLDALIEDKELSDQERKELEELRKDLDEREQRVQAREDKIIQTEQDAKTRGYEAGKQEGEQAAKDDAEETIYKPARTSAAKMKTDAQTEAKSLVAGAKKQAREIKDGAYDIANNFTRKMVLMMMKRLAAQDPHIAEYCEQELKRKPMPAELKNFSTYRDTLIQELRNAKQAREDMVRLNNEELQRQRKDTPGFSL